MRLIFWWNIISPHQSAYVRELAEICDVTVVAAAPMSSDRATFGWSAPKVGRADIIVDPPPARIASLLESGDDCLHILEGFHGCALSRQVLRKSSGKNHICIITERADERGFLGSLRHLRFHTEVTRTSNRVDLLLAMGHLGVDWLKSCGAHTSHLFPFGYCVESPDVADQVISGRDRRSTLKIIYLGQFIKRKAVDILLHSLARCLQFEWELDLIGSGPLDNQLRSLASTLNISGRIHFHGSQSRECAMALLAKADLLVLPSYFDGWGAVVNEALGLGIPVICTSTCGASDLLQFPWLGAVVPPGSVIHMSEALESHMKRGPLSSDLQARIATWASCIQGQSMAKYFTSVLKNVYSGQPRPMPPWLQKSFA